MATVGVKTQDPRPKKRWTGSGAVRQDPDREEMMRNRIYRRSTTTMVVNMNKSIEKNFGISTAVQQTQYTQKCRTSTRFYLTGFQQHYKRKCHNFFFLFIYLKERSKSIIILSEHYPIRSDGYVTRQRIGWFFFFLFFFAYGERRTKYIKKKKKLKNTPTRRRRRRQRCGLEREGVGNGWDDGRREWTGGNSEGQCN